MDPIRIANQFAASTGSGDQPPVLLPSRLSRLNGKPIAPQPKTQRFAEAMAFSDSWSAITEARRRPLL